MSDGQPPADGGNGGAYVDRSFKAEVAMVMMEELLRGICNVVWVYPDGSKKVIFTTLNQDILVAAFTVESSQAVHIPDWFKYPCKHLLGLFAEFGIDCLWSGLISRR